MFEPTEKKQKEKLLNQDKVNEEQYIFYNQNQQHILKYELEIVLSININRKFCVLVDSKTTVGYLSMKICDSIGQFPEFANLEGLKAVNIQKKTDKGLQLCDSNSSEIKDVFENGSTIFCDINTNEYWVKASLNLSSISKKLSVSLELKLNIKMTMHKLKQLLLKTGMYFWMENCQFDDEFHYIYVSANCKTSKSKQNLDFEISDLTAKILIDELTVGDIFDFNSEIICNLKLSSLEEILYDMMRNSYDPDKSVNKIKFEEMKEASFDEFCNLKKFEDEFYKLRQITRKTIKKIKSRSDIKDKIYCINKSNLNVVDDDEIFEEIKNPALIIIMPSKKKKISKINSAPEDNGVLEAVQSSSLSFTQTSLFNNEEEIKPKKQITGNFYKKKGSDHLAEASPLRTSVFSINEDAENSTSEQVFQKQEAASPDKPKEKSHQKDCDETKDLDLDSNQPQQEKKNLADIIKNKILKINTVNLNSDFVNFLDIDKFSQVCESQMKIKVFNHSLERIKVPAFRNVTKNSFENVESWKKRKSTVSKTNPIIKSNTRFYVLVSLLVAVAILILVFLIILLAK